MTMRKFLFGPIAALLALASPAFAQSVALPPNSVVQGMLGVAGKAPTVTGCTIRAGSTDFAGECTGTTTSGTIVFGTPLVGVPFCQVVDATATPTAVYATTNLQITLTTIVSAHVYHWDCKAQSGF